MDAKLKAEWVKALRSGEYKQTSSTLHERTDNTYCCLGVLCKVMGAEFGPAIEEGDDYPLSLDHVPVLNGRVLSNRDDEELKDTFCQEVGIPDQSELIMRNDGVGSDPRSAGYIPRHTFPEIADYIEANL